MNSYTNANKPPERILQFGGGNFLRAFADWMIDILNEQTDFKGSVIIVKPTERGDYVSLRKQNGLFHVVLNGLRDGQTVEEIRQIRCVSRIIQPYREWEDFLKTAALPSLRFVVSNTTEAGIVFNPKDTFSLQQCPNEFPAKLAIWLYQRYQTFRGAADKGCIFLPLELIPDNGTQLQACILKYAAYWKLAPAFSQWIQQQQIFCNTLVDRIVSGYPHEHAARLATQIGIRDELLVAGEAYHNWIIQGPETVAEELPFADTQLNVTFAQDLDIHRKIKVRLLNGAHTSMVPMGLLSGVALVSEAMEHPLIGPFIEELLAEEVIPTIGFPEADLKAFAAAVFNRFRNKAIRHQLISIALNSTSKYASRLLPTLLDYHKHYGKLPQRMALALAALIRMYKGDTEGLKDDQKNLQFFKEAWSTHEKDPSALVETILARTQIWGQDLNKIPELTQTVSTYLVTIEAEGVEAAIANSSKSLTP